MRRIIPQNVTQCTFNFDELNTQPVETVKYSTPTVISKQTTTPSTPGIYKITNLYNSHFYVGSAVNLLKRKQHHFGELKARNHKNHHLQNAYDKYGHDAFRFDIIEHVEHVKNLLTREQHYIDTLNPHYNIARVAGSTLGKKHSSETKAKISASHKGKPNPNLAREFTDETKEKMRAAKIGKKHTPEHIEKCAATRRGRKLSPKHIEKCAATKRGIKRPPETIAKMVATKLAKKLAKQQANQPPIL